MEKQCKKIPRSPGAPSWPHQAASSPGQLAVENIEAMGGTPGAFVLFEFPGGYTSNVPISESLERRALPKKPLTQIPLDGARLHGRAKGVK